MKTIVVLDEATMRGAPARPSFPHEWISHPLSSPADIAARIRCAHIVITNKSPIDSAAIATAKNLELIAVAATGADMIDLAACRTAGVPVCNIRDYASRSVAEHVMALIFCLARGVHEHHRRAVSGEWAASPVFSPDMGKIVNIQGMRIGIIGGGALGCETARLAEVIGMRAVFLRREGGGNSPPRLPLADLLADSDVVSLHCPLTEKTRNLINKKTLAMMKPGAFLINTARGGLVDSAALLDALQSGALGGAGLDVLPTEPPPENDPLLNATLPNLIITPHVAWASSQSLRTFHAHLLENIENFYRGAPQNLLT